MPCQRKSFKGAKQIWVRSALVQHGKISMWVTTPRDHEAEAQLARNIAGELNKTRVQRQRLKRKKLARNRRKYKRLEHDMHERESPVDRKRQDDRNKQINKAAAARSSLYLKPRLRPLSERGEQLREQRRLLGLRAGWRRSARVEQMRLDTLKETASEPESEPEPEPKAKKPKKKTAPTSTPDNLPSILNSNLTIQPKVERSSPEPELKYIPEVPQPSQSSREKVALEAREAEINALRNKAREDELEMKALRELADVLIVQRLKEKLGPKNKLFKTEVDSGMMAEDLEGKQQELMGKLGLLKTGGAGGDDHS